MAVHLNLLYSDAADIFHLFALDGTRLVTIGHRGSLWREGRAGAGISIVFAKVGYSTRDEALISLLRRHDNFKWVGSLAGGEGDAIYARAEPEGVLPEAKAAAEAPQGDAKACSVAPASLLERKRPSPPDPVMSPAKVLSSRRAIQIKQSKRIMLKHEKRNRRLLRKKARV